MKLVTVVIPNWNGKDLLGPCLKSLNEQEFKDFETVVVDNGSNDGSVAFLEKHFPQVKVIQFDENRGFSPAVNAGILASEAPYFALLNNDTEVHPFWLKELVGALEANPEAGSAASKILFFHDHRLINSAGDEFSWFGVAYQRGKGLTDGERYNDPCFVFSACAAAALYRRKLLEKIGFFDEDFFAYHEDVDLGFRAQLAGYPCLFVPTATVFHKYHQTSSGMSNTGVYLRERNKFFVLIKNLPAVLFLLSFPLIMAHEVLCIAGAIRRGHLRVYLHARKNVLTNLLPMVRKRQEIQALRIVSTRYLLGLIQFREPIRLLLIKLQASVGTLFNLGNRVERKI